MSLYKEWIETAYDKNGKSVSKFWDTYLPLEQRIYEELIGNNITEINGTVAELAKKYSLTPYQIAGFVDGISGALDQELKIEELAEDTQLNLTFTFERLYKKMVEYKATHLYTLPQWDKIFTEKERKEFYRDQKKSGTFIRDEKIGRNDPCPCGSGKKYKKCCGI